jgi:N-acetylglucosamine-6-phosphate deacetylase
MSQLWVKGNLLWPHGRIESGVVHIKNGKIEAISKDLPWGRSGDVINVPENGCIAPGFIDIQVNGGFGHDLTSNSEKVLDVAAGWPKYGVTSFLATIITSPLDNFSKAVQNVKKALKEPRGSRANILGIHFEGPYLAPAKGGAHNKKYMRTPSLDDLSIFDPTVVKLVTLAPELPGSIEFIKALTKQGIVVGMGHTEASYETVMDAATAGASWGTHLFNGMIELTHKKPGIVGALLTDKRLRLAVIADCIHIHPGILRLAVAAKGVNGVTLISDAIGATGMPPGDYMLGDLKIVVDGTSSKLADTGGLAGSVLTLDRAVRNMVNAADCKLEDALIMASTTPAETIGVKTKGKLQAGFDADLVILDSDLTVSRTIISGEIVYEKP